MDGKEFVKTVRADPQQKEIPILMVTTEADPEERVTRYPWVSTATLSNP